MRRELIERHVASADGEGFGADGFAAFDVVGGVADDEDLVAAEIGPKFFLGAFVGEAGDAVAVFMVVGKSAGLEMLPELVAAEF